MIKSNIFGAFLLMSFITSELVGCSKSDIQANQVDVGKKEATVSPNSADPTPANQINPSNSPSPTPVVYDVICFQAIGLGVSSTKCGDEGTYKVPRGTKITVSAKTSSSVQGGNQTNTYYESDKNTEKISITEMESLASQGANVYVMYYHMDASMMDGLEPTVEVELYDLNLGKFKMFDKDSSQVVFMTGDTKVRVEKVEVAGGLEYKYKKISSKVNNTSLPTSTQPSSKSTSNSSCPVDKKTFVAAETNNFFVYICGKSSPTNYVGVSKSNGESIILPLQSNSQFTAKNGNYTYTITRQFLTVTQSGKIIRRDSIIAYH